MTKVEYVKLGLMLGNVMDEGKDFVVNVGDLLNVNVSGYVVSHFMHDEWESVYKEDYLSIEVVSVRGDKMSGVLREDSKHFDEVYKKGNEIEFEKKHIQVSEIEHLPY